MLTKPLFLFIVSCCFQLSVNSQTVFKTPSGARYHLANCSSVRNVSEEITIERAVELGLTPCKICNPGNAFKTPLLLHKAQGQGNTVQCAGMTKSGSRCKHMTRIGNGYCFQHQPK